MKKPHSRPQAASGFTLMEVLAGFAISASIIMGVGSLLHHAALSFDRGIGGVNEAERFSLAMDRLSQDFAAAHFISISPDADNPSGGKAAPQLAFKGTAGKVTFVSATDMTALRSEIITLSIETFDGNLSQLVRRTTPWLGPGTGAFEDAKENTVVLMKGRYTIAFAYGELAKNGTMSWSQSWQSDQSLPAAVRLSLRDPASGADLLVGSDFIVRANYPAACSGDADCPSDKNNEKESQDKEKRTL